METNNTKKSTWVRPKDKAQNWTFEHREELRARSRKWISENKEKHAAAQKACKAKRAELKKTLNKDKITYDRISQDSVYANFTDGRKYEVKLINAPRYVRKHFKEKNCKQLIALTYYKIEDDKLTLYYTEGTSIIL